MAGFAIFDTPCFRCGVFFFRWVVNWYQFWFTSGTEKSPPMKIAIKLTSAFLLVMVFASCANGKQLQEQPPSEIGQAYYTSWTGGVKAAGSGYNLFIPVAKDAEIVLDSAYFRGRKAAVTQEVNQPNLYVARFKIPSTEAEEPDMVMHADPRMEYGNKPPVILEKIPFELEADEAVLRYTKNGKVKYFKISGIEKRESRDVKIKNPENIRH